MKLHRAMMIDPSADRFEVDAEMENRLSMALGVLATLTEELQPEHEDAANAAWAAHGLVTDVKGLWERLNSLDRRVEGGTPS